MTEIDRAFEIMQQDMLKKNVVSESEFAEYRALFDTSISEHNQYSNEYLKALIEKYKSRFMVNLPITIVDNSGQVIKTIPPMFVKIPSINKTIKRSGELMTAYTQVMKNDAQPKQKKEMMNQTLHQALTLTLENDSALKVTTEKTLNITKEFEKDVSPKSSSKLTKGMEWK